MIKLTHIAIFLLLSCCLSACGFTLRGSGNNSLRDISLLLQTVQLQSDDGRNSQMLRLVRRALSNNDIDVSEEFRPDIYQIRIGNEQINERIISITSNAKAGEYELVMSLALQFIPGKSLIDQNYVSIAEVLSVEKSYLSDSNSAIAKAEESTLIQTEMRRELSTQIIRRLQALNTQLKLRSPN